MKPLSFLLLTLLLFGCTSPPKENKASAGDPFSIPSANGNRVPVVNSPIADYSPAPSPPASDSQIENQLSVKELRERLEKLKAIERESRQIVALRSDWTKVAQCMRLMERLKPQAKKIAFESDRMMSPAGWEIVIAARSVSVCINCGENEDDTYCHLAREDIADAERALNKATRRK